MIFGGIYYAFTYNDWVGGIWIAFIGWFLDNAANSSYRQMQLTESLQNVYAEDLMTQDCPMVPRGLTLGELFRDQIVQSGRRCFLVNDGERLIGLITLSDLKEVNRERWDYTTVMEAMTPREQLKVALPTDNAATLLERMDEFDINQIPIVDNGQVLGLVARDHLLRLIRTRDEFK
jgi:CBS domain-containing protein